MKIFLIGEDRFLAYNKTAVMHATLGAGHADYRFVSIDDAGRRPIGRYWSYLRGYLKLALEVPRARGPAVFWLSEFKFSPAHAFAVHAISRLKGMKVIGGPHTLSGDSEFLTNAALQTRSPSLRQRARNRLLHLRDRITLSRFDGVQSYTPQYLSRIGSLAPSKRQILFPIGILPELSPIAWALAQQFPRREVSLVFWGIASGLHGLELLPPAAAALARKGINLQVRILSPRNEFVESMLRVAQSLNVQDRFILDHETTVRKDYRVVLSADLALSHLISPSAWQSGRPLMDSLSTNKLFEIMGLGMPVLAARTAATLSFTDDHCCLLTEPADENSLVRMIEDVAEGRVDLQRIAANGLNLVRERFTPHAMVDDVLAQVESLLNARR